MALEIEAKMRIADLEAIRTRLHAAGARFVQRTNETNRFYDTADGRLRRAGRGLRLRTNTHADTGDAEHVVTMKGPLQSGKFKTREELEYAVTNVDAVAAVFEHLGYPPNLSFEKRRESWELNGCKIELDELPVLGTFVEIEGKDESAVEAVRQKLGLGQEPLITTGYATMIAQHLEKSGERALRFTS